MSQLFDLLKKKISGFTEKLKKKVEKKPDSETEAVAEVEIIEEPKPIVEEEPKVVEKAPELVEEPVTEPVEETVPIEVSVEKEVKRELKAKVGATSKIKRIFGGAITIKENDLKELLWELELSLLEADVEQTTAEEICKEIKARLAGKKIGRKERIDDVLKKEIKATLESMMGAKQIDVLDAIKKKEDKPYRILLLGPNGAGKTTTLAKLTHLFQSNGLKVIWSASDTFRAASIEQLEKHADNLGVRVVKHGYGSDPAAVAFDAIKAAQSKNVDVVLIDSAGRQETDKNLMQELQKIDRVAQPDLKIYVGESFTGQALLHQASEYDKIVGLDGFILTKIDTDAKGGTVISLLYKLDKPVLFVGTGQEYKDLQKFEADFVLNRIIG